MSTEVAMRETAFSQQQIDLLKRTIAKGTSDDEFALFVQVCKRTGLDPFARQIHAVKRWSSQDRREVMAIQTGIDGYRVIAERTGKYAGSDDPVYEEAGAEHPEKATVTVYKFVNGQRCPFSASARWSEYCQRTKDGEPFAMWKKMPYLMLGKCAESLALRKAFPAELSGIYTHEEMQQATVIDVPSQNDNGEAVNQREATASIESEGGGNGPPSDLDNPVDGWLAKLRTATSQAAINEVWHRIPEELKQDCYGAYTDRLKAVAKAKNT